VATTTISTTPITIRWDSPQGGAKLTFPITNSDGEASLARLLHDCQPTSFGYGGKDVLDETYRKAARMDRSAFSHDFCPYEVGIIDTIAQVLLPNTKEGNLTNGVRAERYKLNVRLCSHAQDDEKFTPLTAPQIYSAPSGFFKSHVDTPRSEFGSLVVALPCRHEGGGGGGGGK
jgi:hypothetical protein